MFADVRVPHFPFSTWAKSDRPLSHNLMTATTASNPTLMWLGGRFWRKMDLGSILPIDQLEIGSNCREFVAGSRNRKIQAPELVTSSPSYFPPFTSFWNFPPWTPPWTLLLAPLSSHVPVRMPIHKIFIFNR